MFKDHPVKAYLRYSIIAAVLYSIVAFFFIRDETFRSSWILFIGNMLFACCIVAFILLYNKSRKENASIGTMVFAGHLTTVMGIIIACIICLVLFFLMPAASHTVRQTNDAVNNAPAQLQSGERNEYLLALLMSAIIGNVSAGSFISIILSYAAKRNQKGSDAVKTANDPDFIT